MVLDFTPNRSTTTTASSHITSTVEEKRYYSDTTLRKNKKAVQIDPFAGMNSSVNYEKEIEKLKQQIVKKSVTKKLPTLSRSNSPDSSDAESVNSDHVSEAEKARFLAFVRSWTGNWKGGWGEGTIEFNSGSLWSDQSPWNTTIIARPQSTCKKPYEESKLKITSDPFSLNHYDLYSPWKH
ncbi:hypothetical protein G6F57_010631 [Rhizopus arrhizus]|uniref:Uncharacterized protein n=1 Tax=Rhizopus oryzae TaxID=64495 RepID=A0A9P7BN77_RHIOR|nr:hypothetical protein G6F24_002125 [Rhizopus arrhizus]KAG0783487.1 hypothetical protein G6F22_008666 [Rhizopus arrhizus]KAG0783570.1 hypothetical protein G6F21_010455 [Rhizopus arrhizus]KAG0816118.1 hypothetical protein G6F20_003459 [Rhizopus arrhizus]KAG0841970.1 hypothetical protein G6F19_001259 [Rhizopus arrhizus]